MVIICTAAALAACSADSSPGTSQPRVDSTDGNIARCMREKGWDAAADPRGGVTSTDIPDAQMELYDEALHECAEQFAEPQELNLTVTEATALYDTYLGVADCMREHDVAIPEPPSEAAFVEATITGGLPPWDPYSKLFEQVDSLDQLRQIEGACPMPRPSQ